MEEIKQIKDAVSVYTSAFKIFPKDEKIILLLVISQMKRGNLVQATKLYEKFLKLKKKQGNKERHFEKSKKSEEKKVAHVPESFNLKRIHYLNSHTMSI